MGSVIPMRFLLIDLEGDEIAGRAGARIAAFNSRAEDDEKFPHPHAGDLEAALGEMGRREDWRAGEEREIVVVSLEGAYVVRARPSTRAEIVSFGGPPR